MSTNLDLLQPPPPDAPIWLRQWYAALQDALTRISGSFTFDPVTDATRGAPGSAGRVIFNSDDGNLNIDDGTNWILPDGTVT